MVGQHDVQHVEGQWEVSMVGPGQHIESAWHIPCVGWGQEPMGAGGDL